MPTTKLDWPLPFNATVPDADDIQPQCTIVLMNSDRLRGNLAIFEPESGKIGLLLPDGSTLHEGSLKDIKLVQLDRPLMLAKSNVISEKEGIVSEATLESLSIEFLDGDAINITTHGMVKILNGIFLFIPFQNNKYMRQFIPAEAIRKFSLGNSPLGRMLLINKESVNDQLALDHAKQQEKREHQLVQYLTEVVILTPQQLVTAMKDMQRLTSRRLGDSLVEAGLINQEQLAAALKEQNTDRRRPLGRILIEMNVLDEGSINRLLASKMGIPFIKLSKFNIDLSATKLVPEALALKYNLMPLGIVDQRIFVAMENPLFHEALNEVRFHAKKTAEPVMASGEEISKTIKKFYRSKRMEDLTEEISKAIEIDNVSDDVEVEYSESDNTLTRLVNKIILDAHQQGVSDIHVENNLGRKKSIVRFRKDGVMMHYMNLPPSYRNAIISRIKIMAHLDIAEKRKGQDGKINFAQYGPGSFELRVATIPTINGLENVVLRLLANSQPLPLDKIGLTAENLEHIKKLIQRPHGIFLVCGPTGSGKTTTLHSVLGFINNSERKIWTAEDPVEITQDGLCQVQVNPKTGWTFASVLRSFLRADPDVIMVGEMRDGETAKIGVEASLTGHMVMSTLHTNSAPEAIVRLLDMGVDSFNFADALLGVLAQRLTRRLCPDCKQPHLASQEEIDSLIKEYCEVYVQAQCPPPEHSTVLSDWRKRHAGSNNRFTLYSPIGCDNCDNTGYKGRLGLHELFFATPELKKMIQLRLPVSDILAGALRSGLKTLKQDGIEKVLGGFTDIAKVRAAC